MTEISENTDSGKRLWEVEHPYYCNEGNYFDTGDQHRSTGLGPRFRTWADFMEAWGDSDPDYNLLFRWDWREDDFGHGVKFNGDVNYRNGVLVCYWMGQRKGLFNWTETEVCRADEPAVREWLQGRFDHLCSLWSPLSQKDQQHD